MRILGIDPGLATVGFGVVEQRQGRLRPVQYGTILTSPDQTTGGRLERIYLGLKELLAQYHPDCLAVEKLFFNRNVTTALTVGQARGVMLLAAEQGRLPVYEYTPLQVKQSTVGYGQADKRQVQEMVRRLLGLSELPKPDDAADALAVALCHASALPLMARLEEKERLR